MSYEVIVLRQAEVDLYQNALWWAEHRDRNQAAEWLEGFQMAISALCDEPDRYSLVPEDHLFEFAVRQLLYGLGNKTTHRAVFRIFEDRVFVYTIRHLHQKDLTAEDL